MENKSKKHPKGLGVLFFTEMWERFGFYLMLGIFLLYMTAGGGEKFPGLDMSMEDASDIYGTYLALVYLTPFFGGLVADRLLGYRRSIFIGGLLMAAGYIGLSIPNSMPIFFGSLALIILGNGMFKPNISVLLGKLYEGDEYKDLKDAGFNIFYMGINIGAFVCNFVAAYLRLEYGWGFAFAAAGVGMMIGVLWLFFGQKMAPRIAEVDKISPVEEGDMSIKQILINMFVPALAVGALGWIVPGLFGVTILGSQTSDAFLFFTIPLIIFYINLVKKAKPEEKEPIKALLAVMGVVVIFWAVFHQNGSALTAWVKQNTDREMSAAIKPVLSTLKLTEEVSTVPRVREKSSAHGEFQGYELSGSYYFANYDSTKVPAGNLSESIAQTPYPSDMKLYFSKMKNRITDSPDSVNYIQANILAFEKKLKEADNEKDKTEIQKRYDEWKTAKDKWLAEVGIDNEEQLEWEKVNKEKQTEWGIMQLWPTELQASINPFYIIILTPVVVGFFKMLKRKGKEPSTPAKIGFGLLITALSMFVMVGAAIVSDSGTVKTSIGWLFGVYGIITIGELFLSPMGLSLVSKLSPKRIAAVMMGGWFLSTAVGNKLSGILSGTWDAFTHKEYFFLMNMGLTLIAVVGIFILLPWLRKVVTEYEKKAEEEAKARENANKQN